MRNHGGWVYQEGERLKIMQAVVIVEKAVPTRINLNLHEDLFKRLTHFFLV